MPAQYALKLDDTNAYYSVFVKGYNKQEIFLEAADFYYFERLFQRYLSMYEGQEDTYPNFTDSVELLSYCLMPNQIHLLIYQKHSGALPKLMLSLLKSYLHYFNAKYERTGQLFENSYKASRINSQVNFDHTSRAIHLRPRGWQKYPYSSLRYYLDENCPDWLKTNRILSGFTSPLTYLIFLKNYEGYQERLKENRKELEMHKAI